MNPEPKKQFVDSTRELIRSIKEDDHLSAVGLEISIDPEVSNPKVFFSSQWFAEEVARCVEASETFIEVGCGTGIVSIKAAKVNPSLTVYATDINPKAQHLTQVNAEANAVSGRVRTYCGDVLDVIPVSVKADAIFWSMPFGYLEPSDKLSDRDSQAFDPGYRAIRKFFESAASYLKDGGRLLIGFSSDIGHYELLEEIAHKNGFDMKLLAETRGVEKDSVSMEIWECKRKR